MTTNGFVLVTSRGEWTDGLYIKQGPLLITTNVMAMNQASNVRFS